MKERPILFSAPMVRALLENRKTQTRRVLKNPHYMGCLTGDCPHERQTDCNAAIEQWVKHGCVIEGDMPRKVNSIEPLPCPYGQPGDGLWVKETFTRLTVPRNFVGAEHLRLGPANRRDQWVAWYDGTPDPRTGWVAEEKRIPSIFMPRWASRITLEITKVRVERVQEISEADATAEGWLKRAEVSCVPEVHADASRDWYGDLWDLINAKREDGAYAWKKNPWVWVLEFRRVEAR